MRFENEFIGLTVKEVLIDKLGFSKRAVTALKSRPDGILINGAHVTVRAVIKQNDVLEINIDDAESDAALSIVYEDEYIVAVNKPPFMPTHQSQGHFYDTLANALAGHYKRINRPFVFRSVNRLDRNTSGIVLVAKDRVSASDLSMQMKSDKISKSYLAILEGELEIGEGTIETYIRRKEKSIILREVCKCTDDAKLAITKYRVLAQINGLSLVEATPITGRTHQLRVHFAHIGAQILGDDLYGNASPLINRHALHAYKLCFEHPQSHDHIELIAGMSEDMKSIIENNFGKDFLPNERKSTDTGKA